MFIIREPKKAHGRQNNAAGATVGLSRSERSEVSFDLQRAKYPIRPFAAYVREKYWRKIFG